LAAPRDQVLFHFQHQARSFPMFSKRFMSWVGVGVLSVATIPAFAAPHLARLAARHPVAKTTTTHNKTKPAATKLAAKPAPKPAAKPVAAKATTLAHVPAKTATKKTVTARTTKLATVTHKTASPKKHLTTGHKLNKPAAHKALAAAPRHTAASKAIIH
jgi:hypothetical protein